MLAKTLEPLALWYHRRCLCSSGRGTAAVPRPVTFLSVGRTLEAIRHNTVHEPPTDAQHEA